MRLSKHLLLLGLSFFLLCGMLYAQERTVTGTVVDNSNLALEGVTVRVKGTSRVTQTDNNGRFSISAAPNQVLEVSYVGFQTREIRLGTQTNISISIQPGGGDLGEVIVTAMDIKRNSRELGYSVQKVSGAEIKETQRENFLNGMQGRVAGLTITPTTGMAGASSQIVLRGFNSLSLGNQPLFIVDGIILDNSTMNETSNGGSGLGLASDRPNRNNDYTNRIADLNPNDIESITVLKGPEATALYGSQASSGAVVITSKRAAPGKVRFDYDNSFRFRKMNRYNDVDNSYSTGVNGNANFPGASFQYFGPAYPEGTLKYDNIDNFFRTGFANTQNVSADWGTKNAGFRLSGSYFNEASPVPTNEFTRYNLKLSNTTKIGKKLSITPSIQYISSTNSKPLRSAGGYLLNLYVWPVTDNISTYLNEDGSKRTLYLDNANGETDNPLFSANMNNSTDENRRYVATMGVDYNPTDWLSVAGRFGYDHYKTEGYTFYHPQSSVYAVALGGFLDNYWTRYYGYNHTITATARKELGKFSGRVMVGTMWQDYERQMFAIAGNQLKDNFSKDSNNTGENTRVRLLRNNFNEWNKSITRQSAYFGEAAISYNNLLFLSYTHRFESASVFPKQFRNYNYPGLSLSAILTDIVPQIKGQVFDYVKLRASRASTARLMDPYMNQSVFVNNFASSDAGLIYSYGFFNNNEFLQPERQNTFEIGTEIKMFNSRLSIDAAYYNTLCKDQISQGFRASYATGFVLNTQNAASTRNKGLELVVDVNPVRKQNFTWNIRFNFNKMWNEVLSLPEAIQGEYYIADTWIYGNARGGLYRNQPTTTITGFHYMRNDRGDILINPTSGLPVVEGTFTPIGDRNPDFTLGTLNTLRYKNWSLNFLWDLKVGGDVFNATDRYLTLQGKSKRTSDRNTPRVLEGVLNDGLQNTDNPTKNTIVITPALNSSYYTTMPEEEFIEKDVNWFRLRDVSLSYNFPAATMERIKAFKSLGLFVTANDLVLFTNYTGADPASNGNTAASAGVGGFGFDFGNLPTPIAVNAGIRVGF